MRLWTAGTVDDWIRDDDGVVASIEPKISVLINFFIEGNFSASRGLSMIKIMISLQSSAHVCFLSPYLTPLVSASNFPHSRWNSENQIQFCFCNMINDMRSSRAFSCDSSSLKQSKWPWLAWADDSEKIENGNEDLRRLKIALWLCPMVILQTSS